MDGDRAVRPMRNCSVHSNVRRCVGLESREHVTLAGQPARHRHWDALDCSGSDLNVRHSSFAQSPSTTHSRRSRPRESWSRPTVTGRRTGRTPGRRERQPARHGNSLPRWAFNGFHAFLFGCAADPRTSSRVARPRRSDPWCSSSGRGGTTVASNATRTLPAGAGDPA